MTNKICYVDFYDLKDKVVKKKTYGGTILIEDIDSGQVINETWEQDTLGVYLVEEFNDLGQLIKKTESPNHTETYYEYNNENKIIKETEITECGWLTVTEYQYHLEENKLKKTFKETKSSKETVSILGKYNADEKPRIFSETYRENYGGYKTKYTHKEHFNKVMYIKKKEGGKLVYERRIDL